MVGRDWAVKIDGIWLRYEGGENDPKASVVVEVLVGDDRYEVIREPHSGAFSHFVTANCIRRVVDNERRRKK